MRLWKIWPSLILAPSFVFVILTVNLDTKGLET